MDRPFPRRPLLLSLICSAAIFACTLSYPFNNDNALYAYMSALLLEGRLPYLGSWDQNFPGILLIHTPQILLFGRSQLAFHLWDIAIQLVGAYYLFRLGLRWGGREAAMLAPVICAFYYVQQGLWMAGERDTYVTILLLAALYHITSPKIQKNALLTGTLIGLAILFRPTYGLLALAFILYSLLETRRIYTPAATALGVALPVLALAAIYLAAGGMDDLYEATIRFNTEVYIGQGSVFSFWEPIRFYAALIPFASYGLWRIWRSDPLSASLLVLSFGACLVSLLLLYRHSVYHYHPAMTIMLLLGAVGLGRAIRLIHNAGGSRQTKVALRVAAFTAIFAFFAIQTVRGNTIKFVLADIWKGEISTLGEAYEYYEGSPSFGAGVQQRVGEYLAARTDDGEAVQMFGPYSYPQYLSLTSTASRFQTLHALTMRAEGGELTPMQMEWRQEYLADLDLVRPMYFIVCDAPDAFRQYYGGRLGHEILREDMTEVGEWLKKGYVADTVIGAFTIYRLNAR